jgi:DNA repair protein RadC
MSEDASPSLAYGREALMRDLEQWKSAAEDELRRRKALGEQVASLTGQLLQYKLRLAEAQEQCASLIESSEQVREVLRARETEVAQLRGVLKEDVLQILRTIAVDVHQLRVKCESEG